MSESRRVDPMVIPPSLLEKVMVAADDLGQSPEEFVADAIRVALESWGEGLGGNTLSLRCITPEDDL